MSDETDDAAELEQLLQLERKAQEKAAAVTVAEPEPQPAPVQAAPVEAQEQVPEAPVEAVTPPAQGSPNADDPMEWAKKKGLNSPESIARSLQQMEREFHTRNQQGHPGYQDIPNGNPAPQQMPPPNWQPRPDMGNVSQPNYGYQNQPAPRPSRQEISQRLADKHGLNVNDVDAMMPLLVEVSEQIAYGRTANLERELADVRRQSARNSELMNLSQDPAFSDPRVQKEMHEVLKDGSIFQRSGTPYATAFQVALGNLARKQLQQGSIPETTNRPPVTAGGGSGSKFSVPKAITPEVFNSWSDKEQDAYMNSGGRIVPKR